MYKNDNFDYLGWLFQILSKLNIFVHVKGDFICIEKFEHGLA